MLDLSENAAVIYYFLSGYKLAEVRQALRAYGILKKEHKKHQQQALQQALDKGNWEKSQLEEPPEGYDFTFIRGELYIRKPPPEPKKAQGYVSSKTTVSRSPIYTCPACGDKVYSYKLCTACDKAKAGLTFSNTCSNCSFTFFTDEDPSKRQEDEL